MKKILAVTVFVIVLGVAGLALAVDSMDNTMSPQSGMETTNGMQTMPCMQGSGMMGGGGSGMMSNARGMAGMRCMQNGGMMSGGMRQGMMGGMNMMKDMPQDIREKFVEAQKMVIDLQSEMSKRPLDRSKIAELRVKVRELQNAVSDWQFNQNLDALEQDTGAK